MTRFSSHFVTFLNIIYLQISHRVFFKMLETFTTDARLINVRLTLQEEERGFFCWHD
jgi:hypothetical protein